MLHFACLILTTLTLSLSAQAYTVLVDAGHGGRDSGASLNGVIEANITLTLAKKIEQRFKSHPTIHVVLSRSADRSLSLEERTELSQTKQVDLFLSIHANASIDPRAKGVELYIQNQLSQDEQTFFLAHSESQTRSQKSASIKKSELETIVEDLGRQYRQHESAELAKSLYSHWRGFKKSRKKYALRQAPFYVISNNSVPSVLLEVGYLSHPKEGQKLQDPVYQNLIADSVYEGLLQYTKSL